MGTKTTTPYLTSLWVFQMPTGHEHTMEIDYRGGPSEDQGGLILRGPFNDDTDGYLAALAWIVERSPDHPDYDRLWPVSHAARILVDQISQERYQEPELYLAAGTVCYVNDVDETGLFVQHDGSILFVPFDQAIPVPNSLDISPEYIMSQLPADMRIVGDLLNDGYTLIRLQPGTDEFADWEAFLQIYLGDDPLVILVDQAADVWITRHNPTTVTFARQA